MLTVLILMTMGILVGFLIRNNMSIIKIIDPSTNIAIYILLFLLGSSVGVNKTIMANLDTLGSQALLLALGGVVGSVVIMYFVQKIFFKTNG